MSAACASCLVCGSVVSDIHRGWVRNPTRPSDPRIWFLCGSCLDRDPHLSWDDNEPALRFFGRACRCAA